MRYRKLRGHRRIWKAIGEWKERHLHLDLKELEKQQRYYVKLYVGPYARLNLSNSEIPQPTGKTRQLLLEGLLDIHDAWQLQLEAAGSPYYLRIWLFEPEITRSQVVCATGDFLHFYDNTFHRPEVQEQFQPGQFGPLADRMRTLQWEHAYDEIHIDNTEPGDPSNYASRADFLERRKWVRKMLSRPHRVTKFSQPIGEATGSYSIRTGDVWIGGN